MKASKKVASVDDLKPSELNFAERFIKRKLSGDAKVKNILKSEMQILFKEILSELIQTQIYNFTETQQKLVPKTEELQTTDWVKKNKQLIKSLPASPNTGEIMKAINQSVNSLSSKKQLKKTMLENMQKAITKSLQISTKNDSKIPEGSSALKECLETTVKALSENVIPNRQTIYDGVCSAQEKEDILMLVFVSQFCSWEGEGHFNRRVDTKEVCTKFKTEILQSSSNNWSSLNRIMTHNIGTIILSIRTISSDQAIYNNDILREQQKHQEFVRNHGQITYSQDHILKDTTHITDKLVFAHIATLCDKVGMIYYCLLSIKNIMRGLNIKLEAICDLRGLITENFFQGEKNAMNQSLFYTKSDSESADKKSAPDYYFFTPGSPIPDLGGKLAINIWIIHRIWDKFIIPQTGAGNMIKLLIDSICTDKERAHNPGTLPRDNPSQSYEGNPGALVQDMLTGNIYKLVLN